MTTVSIIQIVLASVCALGAFFFCASFSVSDRRATLEEIAFIFGVIAAAAVVIHIAKVPL